MRASILGRWLVIAAGVAVSCLTLDERSVVDREGDDGEAGGESGGSGGNGGSAGSSSGKGGSSGSATGGRGGTSGASTGGGEGGENTGGMGDTGGTDGTGGTSGSTTGGTAGSGTGGASGSAGNGGSGGSGGAPPSCGNGSLDGSEACDDGNGTAADGCTNCAVDTGFNCNSMEPTVCTPICGDSRVVRGEACDDGGTAPGDGCSAACAIETGFGCWGMPSTCSRSCAGVSATACQGESCCARVSNPGGNVLMGRGTEMCSGCVMGCPPGITCVDTESGSDTPQHGANVNAFVLDKYEITVGRFRNFIASYAGPPATGSGAHPTVSGSGWQAAWNSSMPTTAAALRTNVTCSGTTFTTNAGPNEQLPMNCVNWFEAFAFCIWDGGRLPTEAEWEFAAAGGNENRVYPWGGDPPTASHAVFNCPATCTGGLANILPVGSKPGGAGRLAERDLSGSLREWVFDYYAVYTSSLCSNCAQTTQGPAGNYRVLRGGGWRDPPKLLRAADRFITELYAPHLRNDSGGFRCIRSL
jgi:sulfatase modifying factor 1